MSFRKNLRRAATVAVLFAALPLSTVTAVTGTTPAQRLDSLKSKGSTEIDRRLANLSATQVKLNAATKLTAADREALMQQLQAQSTGLTALKAKLTAETELASARADVQSMVTDYRVYALLLPKTRMVALTDRFAAAEIKLTTLIAQLQTKVDTHRSAGHDVAELQTNLDTATAKIAAAKTATDGLASKLIALQSTDYNTSHTVLLRHRETLKTAQTSLKAGRDAVKATVEGLKVLK